MGSNHLIIKKWLPLIFIFLVITASFSSSLDNQYTNWDDESHFLHHPLVRSFDFFAIFRDITNATYIPLTILSFALEYQVFGFNPFVSHLINLILHLAVVGLIYFLAKKLNLTDLAAGLAALLFGIHPMHVESVAWVTERKDVLYSLFYLLSFLQYINYLEGKKRAFYFSLVFGFLSILTKPMALSLPLVLFVLDWYQKRKFTKNVFFEKIPFFLFIVPIAWVTYLLNARLPSENTIFESALVWLWTFSFYIQKFIFPLQLVPLYDLPKPISLGNIQYILSIVTIVFLVLGLKYLNKSRLFTFALLFYFASIFFLLRFDQTVDISFVADRFMYLPSLGFCLLFGVLIDQVLNYLNHKKRILYKFGIVCIITIFAFLSSKTFRQNNIWQDSFALWSTIIEHNPNNPHVALAYYNRGKAYNYQGKLNEAMSDYTKAIELKDDYFDAYNNRGIIYEQLGKYELALADLNKAIEINPEYDRTFINKGNILDKLGLYSEAVDEFNRALELNPDFAIAFNNRGLSFFRQRYFELALKDFDQAINLIPDYVDAYFNKGNVYKAVGKLDRALVQYNRALELAPQDVRVLLNRGNVYGQLREYRRAIEDYSRLIRINPNVAESYSNRAISYQAIEEFDLALADLKKALSFDDQSATVNLNMGNLFFVQGKYDDAIKNYNVVIQHTPQLGSAYFQRSKAYAAKEEYQPALKDAKKAKELGQPNLLVYIAKLEKLINKEQ